MGGVGPDAGSWRGRVTPVLVPVRYPALAGVLRHRALPWALAAREMASRSGASGRAAGREAEKKEKAATGGLRPPAPAVARPTGVLPGAPGAVGEAPPAGDRAGGRR